MKATPKKSLFLFKKFSTINRSINENIIKNEPLDSIKIKPYAIYIKNSSEEFILDLQELREILNKIFPTFISYTIAINNYNTFAGIFILSLLGYLMFIMFEQFEKKRCRW